MSKHIQDNLEPDRFITAELCAPLCHDHDAASLDSSARVMLTLSVPRQICESCFLGGFFISWCAWNTQSWVCYLVKKENLENFLSVWYG